MSELRRVSAGILIAFLFVALSAAYWSVVGAEGLLSREDNPRLIEAEAVLQRGRIFDRQGLLLATTTVNANGQGLRRLYPHPEVAPAVGYYSARFGTSGIEATYDALLRGQIGPSPLNVWQRKLLHAPAAGGDVRLTLDLRVQQAAAEALDGLAGAVVIATIPDGAIRAIVSAPIFDPNVLDDDWDVLVKAPNAPLLNRVTQGLYQPGGILETPLLATAIAHQASTNTLIPNSTAPLPVNGLTLTCGVTPPRLPLDLEGAYVYACPSAFAQIITQVTPESIDLAFWRNGLLTAPILAGLNTEIADSPLPLAFLRDETLIQANLAGQGALTITPLQALEIIAAIANDGNAPRYRLVEATREPGADAWEPVPESGISRAVLTRQTAQSIRTLMQRAAAEGTAAAAAAESAHPVIGHAATAYTGPEAQPLQWFIGMVRFEDGSAVAAVVVIEGSEQPAEAARIGGIALDVAAEVFAPQGPTTNTP